MFTSSVRVGGSFPFCRPVISTEYNILKMACTKQTACKSMGGGGVTVLLSRVFM